MGGDIVENGLKVRCGILMVYMYCTRWGEMMMNRIQPYKGASLGGGLNEK